MSANEHAKTTAWAEEYNRHLRADDPRLTRAVYVRHQDGSTFFFRYAFTIATGDYWVVFAEHQRPQIYHIEDVELREYMGVEVQRLDS